MKSIKVLILISAFVIPVIIYGCGANNNFNRAAIDEAGDTGAGGVMGQYSDNTIVGIIIGAAVGGTAGAWIGSYMDKQAEEMQNNILGAKIERIGEGIKITFDSEILFAANSSLLEPRARQNINNLALILNKYSDTNILIIGHTDFDGTHLYNQALSEQRAKTVNNYAGMQGVSSSRFSVIGLGEAEPIASNDTQDGKRMNRRVEIAVFANDKLKTAAEKGGL